MTRRLLTGLGTMLVVLAASLPAHAALIVVPVGGSVDATALAATLLGSNPGITINSATYTGAAAASGTFSGGQPIIGLASGVLLTTGAVALAPGPNDNPLATVDNFLPGDPDLDAIAGQSTVDASLLTIAFTPSGSAVRLDYVFASEEYPIGLLSGNDAFGAFVNGTNAALLPGTGQPVTVLTVNGTTNSQLFISNPMGAPDLQYDGFTTVLSLIAPVIPGQVNILKLAIGDGLDGIGDSGVFLGAGSFAVCGPGVPCPTPVPEPATVLLLGGALAGWSVRRARRARA